MRFYALYVFAGYVSLCYCMYFFAFSRLLFIDSLHYFTCHTGAIDICELKATYLLTYFVNCRFSMNALMQLLMDSTAHFTVC